MIEALRAANGDPLSAAKIGLAIHADPLAVANACRDLERAGRINPIDRRDGIARWTAPEGDQ